MGQTNVPSCIPVGEAGVPNPGAALPAKIKLTKRKKGKIYHQPLTKHDPGGSQGVYLTKEAQITDPGYVPKREAGVTNPEADTPCKKHPKVAKGKEKFTAHPHHIHDP